MNWVRFKFLSTLSVCLSLSLSDLLLYSRFMTNPSASYFCLLHLSSGRRCLCLWYRWAFASAFILLLLCPPSNPAFCPITVNHACVAVLYPRCSCFLDCLQDFIIRYPVNSANFSVFLQTHISKANCISLSAQMSRHHREQCCTIYVTLYYRILFLSCIFHFPVNSRFFNHTQLLCKTRQRNTR